jgi:hypothetical protein
MSEEVYSFDAIIWKSGGFGGWHFATLPKELSVKIRKKYWIQEEGWGRLKATACIGNTKWKTAIWFDTKKGSYLLPVKTSVRKEENIDVDDNVAVSINISKQ